LVYQVVVSATGDILGYRAESDPALLNVDATPLPTLTYLPVDPGAAVEEPVAQFRVTLGADGTITAEPLATPSASDTASAAASNDDEAAAAVDAPPLSAAIADEVEDGDRLRAMNRDLYATLRDSRDRGTLEEDLVYRVRWTEAGELVGFEPDSNTAADQVGTTPLPDLLETNPGTADTPQADFRVVFGADGVLEVSPWKGFPR
ncbi:MAG: hypothetical protein O3C67_05330, partial [Cyanobacteria bacterium]|nr:hypothetical protein [Cyanobacteriota bacterium]